MEKNCVFRVGDFVFIPRIFGSCTPASRLGYRLVVITNQAGIGRGCCTEANCQHPTDWMLDEFRRRDIAIDRGYQCHYHPTAGTGEYWQDSFHRNPNPGMILNARDELGLDLSESVLVGDKDSDTQTGITADVQCNIRLSHSGHHDPGRLETPLVILSRSGLSGTTGSRLFGYGHIGKQTKNASRSHASI